MSGIVVSTGGSTTRLSAEMAAVSRDRRNRTDPEAPKHRGISYFLVDMKSSRISVRPIVNMANGAGLAPRAVEIDIYRLLAYRIAWMQSRREVPSCQASMAKALGTEMQQRLTNFGVNLMCPYGGLELGSRRAPIDGRLGFKYLWNTAPTSFAGTGEIQRNIIANRGSVYPEVDMPHHAAA